MRSSELFGKIRTPDALGRLLDKLIDGWCERRCLAPLRLLLPAWPLRNSLTDDWGDLLVALKGIELLSESGIDDADRDDVAEARRYVEHVVYDR
jgi:hypothetical protein